jgi:hypothetical protein
MKVSPPAGHLSSAGFRKCLAHPVYHDLGHAIDARHPRVVLVADQVERPVERDLIGQDRSQFRMLAGGKIRQDSDAGPAQAPAQLHDQAV